MSLQSFANLWVYRLLLWGAAFDLFQEDIGSSVPTIIFPDSHPSCHFGNHLLDCCRHPGGVARGIHPILSLRHVGQVAPKEILFFVVFLFGWTRNVQFPFIYFS